MRLLKVERAALAMRVGGERIAASTHSLAMALCGVPRPKKNLPRRLGSSDSPQPTKPAALPAQRASVLPLGSLNPPAGRLAFRPLHRHQLRPRRSSRGRRIHSLWSTLGDCSASKGDSSETWHQVQDMSTSPSMSTPSLLIHREGSDRVSAFLLRVLFWSPLIDVEPIGLRAAPTISPHPPPPSPPSCLWAFRHKGVLVQHPDAVGWRDGHDRCTAGDDEAQLPFHPRRLVRIGLVCFRAGRAGGGHGGGKDERNKNNKAEAQRGLVPTGPGKQQTWPVECEQLRRGRQ